MHLIQASFEFFFICSSEIFCKFMGNFAENFNLGKRVLPSDKMHMLYFKKVLIISSWSAKHVDFVYEVEYPLSTPLFISHYPLFYPL